MLHREQVRETKVGTAEGCRRITVPGMVIKWS